jgi:hypothetical protein
MTKRGFGDGSIDRHSIDRCGTSMDVQALMQTETDSADRRREVPDVRSFDRCGDDEQRSRSVGATIVAKTPMSARHNNLVGTFLWVQSKRANDITLRTAKNVADIKLRPVKSASWPPSMGAACLIG